MPLWMEPIALGQDFSIFLDQAWDPWSVRQCIKSLKGTIDGRLICVVSIDPRLSPEECAILGRTVESSTHLQILTADGEADRLRRVRKMHSVLDGFSDPAAPMIVPHRQHAVEYALSQAQRSDVVLVLGCGGSPAGMHHERDVATAWLQSRGTQRDMEFCETEVS